MSNVVSNCAVMAVVLFYHKQKKTAQSCAVLTDNNVEVFENFKIELFTTFTYVQYNAKIKCKYVNQ